MLQESRVLDYLECRKKIYYNLTKPYIEIDLRVHTLDGRVLLQSIKGIDGTDNFFFVGENCTMRSKNGHPRPEIGRLRPIAKPLKTFLLKHSFCFLSYFRICYDGANRTREQ